LYDGLGELVRLSQGGYRAERTEDEAGVEGINGLSYEIEVVDDDCDMCQYMSAGVLLKVYTLLSGGRSDAGPTVSSSRSPFTASTSILSAISASMRMVMSWMRKRCVVCLEVLLREGGSSKRNAGTSFPWRRLVPLYAVANAFRQHVNVY